MNNIRIHLIDDDQSLLRVMQHHLTQAGYEVESFNNASDAVKNQIENPAAILITDLKMPGMSGIEMMAEIREFDSKALMIVITGFPTIDVAVEAMKLGAFDFIQKPIEKEHLLAVTKKAVEYFQIRTENQRLRTLVADHLDFGNMIARAPTMQKVINQARQAANSNATVLVLGETGTGKEMLAKAIHQNSQQKDASFIPINCAAVPSTLLESELFGHIRGAFTGAVSDRKGLIEEADGGTLFLDEIGDLPLELQPKLLRVLQEREIQPVGSNTIKKVNVRFIVATHRNLEEMVGENRFRQDLYFRLNVIPITIPPIRNRIEDIVPLFRHFLKEAATLEGGKPVPGIEPEVAVYLEKYQWPGNVREIQNIARRVVALSVNDIITTSDLPESIRQTKNDTSSPPHSELPSDGFDLEEWIDRLVLSALEKNDWNQSQTAKYLRISRNSLIYRMENRPILKEAKVASKQGF